MNMARKISSKISSKSVRNVKFKPLRGEDVAEVTKALKETAGGLDQWDPADFKLLSSVALGWHTHLLNDVEATHMSARCPPGSLHRL